MGTLYCSKPKRLFFFPVPNLENPNVNTKNLGRCKAPEFTCSSEKRASTKIPSQREKLAALIEAPEIPFFPSPNIFCLSSLAVWFFRNVYRQLQKFSKKSLKSSGYSCGSYSGGIWVPNRQDALQNHLQTNTQKTHPDKNHHSSKQNGTHTLILFMVQISG